MDRIDRLARHLAAKGRAEVLRLRDIVERALILLDDPGFLSDPAVPLLAPPPPCPWEQTELFAVGARRSVYQAVTIHEATGQGMDLHYHAGLARSESEVRRHLATTVGSTLADAAHIVRGAEAHLPHDTLFVSPRLRDFLRGAEEPGGQPAILSLDARFHFNAG